MDYIKDNKEISAEEAVILWQASRLSLSKSYEKAPEILKVHGSVIGTLGNFSASIGKAKSKKTFNVSAIVAAALRNGTVLRYVAELPEDKRKILYVDTEQSPYHCLKVMKRILRMAGLPDDRDNENLEFLALRKYTPEQRIRIVEQGPGEPGHQGRSPHGRPVPHVAGLRGVVARPSLCDYRPVGRGDVHVPRHLAGRAAPPGGNVPVRRAGRGYRGACVQHDLRFRRAWRRGQGRAFHQGRRGRPRDLMAAGRVVIPHRPLRDRDRAGRAGRLRKDHILPFPLPGGGDARLPCPRRGRGGEPRGMGGSLHLRGQARTAAGDGGAGRGRDYRTLGRDGAPAPHRGVGLGAPVGRGPG